MNNNLTNQLQKARVEIATNNPIVELYRDRNVIPPLTDVKQE